MSDIVVQLQDKILLLTLNRASKHNAFDDSLLTELQLHLDEAQHNPTIRVVVLKANGHHFSAGADLAWMQRMTQCSEAENLDDAKILAKVMYSLHHLSKPTIAMVHGSAFGGGAGLVAACDIGIAAHSARFCFSEVKLGLIPAVISPYVIKAIGARNATALFVSAELINSQRARELQLIHHCVAEEELLAFTLDYAQKIAQCAPLAVKQTKALVQEISALAINEHVIELTAAAIAKKRVSAEGQKGLLAFLNKAAPNWD